ncbi:hypothetical protein [Caudoviricetes sp.]|nr:hypothetical protein [Caudoviricetes sp.]
MLITVMEYKLITVSSAIPLFFLKYFYLEE